jgi:uncharacterized protein (DUF169 family)
MNMVNLDYMHGWGEEIGRRLRLQSFPFALKLLEKEEDIPEGAVRPKKDLGQHLFLCQAFQMSRREGTIIAMLKEDMVCFEPVIGYGLAEPPQYFMDGHNRFPEDVETLEAGKNYAHEFPRLETGKYIGVISAPLVTANFEPDIVLLYVNPAQLTLLLLGREYRDGYNLKCALSGHAACVYSVVPSIQSGKCQVAIPCRGDRWLAMAADDELIFSVPTGKMEDLMLGLKRIDETGSKMPFKRVIKPDAEPAESYRKLAKMLGMDVY